MGQKVNVAQRVLYDIRDSNFYTVRKLADGNCWMTENLRLTGPKTLTSADSNVSSNWTLPAVNETFPTSCVDTAYNMKSSTDAATYASYGNYYNWYAATAGTGTCAMESGSATTSICPKGWRLPTGGEGGEFQTLYSSYNSSTFMMNVPTAFVLSGNRYDVITYNQTVYGYYWSSTVYSSSDVYELILSSSGALPSDHYYKLSGFSVRCAAQ